LPVGFERMRLIVVAQSVIPNPDWNKRAKRIIVLTAEVHGLGPRIVNLVINRFAQPPASAYLQCIVIGSPHVLLNVNVSIPWNRPQEERWQSIARRWVLAGG